MNIKLNGWVLSACVVVLLFIDQLVKVIIKLSMTIGESIHVCGDWFQIKFIENRGAAYGFEISEGDWGKLLLSLIRVVAIIALTYYMRHLLRQKAPKGVIVGFALIFAGAVGNLLDSMFYGLIFSASDLYQVAHCTPWGEGYATFLHGSVVDMFYFPIINTVLPNWVPIWGGEPFVFFSPIFNVADSYISLGFIYLVIFEHRYFNKEEENKKLK